MTSLRHGAAGQMFVKHRIERPFSADGGYAFISTIPPALERLRSKSPDRWRLIVTENEKPLGPSDSQHQHIRDVGAGAFSVWHGEVFFSASDGSDCNSNGYDYEILALDLGQDSGLYQDIVQRIIADDRELLRLIARSAEVNNNIFANLFRYFNEAMIILKRNGVAFPKSVLELGSGAKPYVALRYLLEGATRFVANDLGAIDGHYLRGFGSNLRSYLETVNPDYGTRFDRLIEGSPQFGLNGLEVWDKIAFENIPIPDKAFDLITSVSVLEHVMQPDDVVRRTAELLKDDGHILHGVDLRDHRDFGDPLRFLTMSAADYARVNTENRLRLSDWLVLFDRHGFEVIDKRYTTLSADEIARGTSVARAGNRHHATYDEIVPWVTEEMRATFVPPYDSKELRDLSITSIVVLLRKRR